jgi:branched-chain amino acid transport system permease protein
MTFLLHIAVFCSIYIVLTVSLDLLAGQTGLLSVAHGAFFGVGAYASAILTTFWHLPFAIAVVVGMLTASLVSVFVSVPSLRLRGDYFIIATFAFQMIVFSVFNNCVDLTRGPLGIASIPHPVLLGWRIDSHLEFLLLALYAVGMAAFVVIGLSSSPFGRVLRAIREDDLLTQCLGRNTIVFKVVAFAVSSALAASAGSLYAHYVRFIDPTSFTVTESILVLSMLIIGGAGSRWGPPLGATALVVLPEVLRLVGLPSALAASLRQLIYGAFLIAIVLYRPEGLLGDLAPEREAKTK